MYSSTWEISQEKANNIFYSQADTLFLEAVAKAGHEKTLQRGHESQNAQRPHRQRLYQRDVGIW